MGEMSLAEQFKAAFPKVEMTVQDVVDMWQFIEEETGTTLVDGFPISRALYLKRICEDVWKKTKDMSKAFAETYSRLADEKDTYFCDLKNEEK